MKWIHKQENSCDKIKTTRQTRKWCWTLRLLFELHVCLHKRGNGCPAFMIQWTVISFWIFFFVSLFINLVVLLFVFVLSSVFLNLIPFTLLIFFLTLSLILILMMLLVLQPLLFILNMIIIITPILIVSFSSSFFNGFFCILFKVLIFTLIDWVGCFAFLIMLMTLLLLNACLVILKL